MGKNDKNLLQITDMHTAGEPVRIIDARHLDLGGDNFLERRSRFEIRFDHIRRAAMMEPRGHADMYGVVLVQPCGSDAELGAIFVHNSGYSSMCGHVCMALARFLADEQGLDDGGAFSVECPCGLIAISHNRNAKPYSSSSVIEVPGKVVFKDLELNMSNHGAVRFDVCYGGAYYAVLSAADIGIDFTSTSTDEIRSLLKLLVQEARNQITIPLSGLQELAFLYGAILTEHDELFRTETNRHVCLFGNGQIDRSPTGSGVAARLALATQNHGAKVGITYEFAGVSGITFLGRIISHNGGQVQTEISGASYYTGKGVMLIESDDPVAYGFVPNHVH